MSKSEKIKKLEVYKARIKDLLTAGATDKHKHHPAEYIQFLSNELTTVDSSITKLRVGD